MGKLLLRRVLIPRQPKKFKELEVGEVFIPRGRKEPHVKVSNRSTVNPFTKATSKFCDSMHVMVCEPKDYQGVKPQQVVKNYRAATQPRDHAYFGPPTFRIPDQVTGQEMRLAMQTMIEAPRQRVERAQWKRERWEQQKGKGKRNG